MAAKSDFLAKDDEGKATQMILFRDNIGGHLATLGLLPTDPIIVQQARDATYFRALLNFNTTNQQFAQGSTKWKNYERDGGAVAVSTPALPVLPSGFPAAVPPGIVPRFRFAAAYVKKQPNYTPAIGEVLGIEGPVQTAPDLNTVQPVLDATVTGAGVGIGWDWGGNAQFLQGCEIQCDRGTGAGFVTVMMDNTPGWEDNTPFRAAPVKWTYRAIYIVGDKRVGLWSAPVSVNVGG
jgi:hypothetical protein